MKNRFYKEYQEKDIQAFEYTKKLQKENVKVLILKAKSPSCGYKQVYDGTFSKTLIDGHGVFAKLAIAHGFTIYTEKDIEEMYKK